MNVTHLSIAALCTAGLTAQGLLPSDGGFAAPKSEQPTAASIGATNPGAFRLDAVAYDRPGDGMLWASGRTYKASVARDAFTYYPFLGSTAPRDFPVAFALRSVKVAGEALPLGASDPSQAGDRAEVARGSVTEVYDFSLTSVEQSFRFDALPARGDLVLTIGVDSELVPAVKDGAIELTNELGTVRYDHAVAVDANGERQALPISLRGKDLELAVPASFVAHAALPLVVDPVIATLVVTGISGNYDTPTVDIAYDASLGQYAVVWQLAFSATDTDVWIRFCNDDLAWIGVTRVVDNSNFDWRNARVASHGSSDKFLVVAQVDDPTSWIGGRLVTGTPSLLPQMIIDKAGEPWHGVGSKRNPDVAGSALGDPTYFTVVWQAHAVGHDGDIMMKQVETDGTLRNPVPQAIAATSDIETYPSISSSGGVAALGDQRWLVAFQRGTGPSTSTTENLYGALLNFDGQIMATPNGTVFPIDTGAIHLLRPSVSSPTLPIAGNTWFMVVCQDATNAADSDVRGTLVDTAGNAPVHSNLSLLDGSKAVARPQLDPTVDTDGTRFAVAFAENWFASDYDTRLSLFALEPAGMTLSAHESRVPLRWTSSYEEKPRVFANASGGADSARYAVIHATNFEGTHLHGELFRYDGLMAGGFASRATGCSGLAIEPFGTPAIGHAIGFHVTSGVGDGFTIGLPDTIALPCASGCVLGTTSFLNVTSGLPLTMAVPADANLPGLTISVQAYSLAIGTCFGTVALSNTIDVTVQ